MQYVFLIRLSAGGKKYITSISKTRIAWARNRFYIFIANLRCSTQCDDVTTMHPMYPILITNCHGQIHHALDFQKYLFTI